MHKQLTIGLATVAIACSANADIYVDVDRFSGTTITEARGANRDTLSLSGQGVANLYLYPLKVASSDGSAPIYRIRVRWYASDWLFMSADTRMVFLVDGENHEIRSDAGSERNRDVSASQFGVYVEEIVYFSTDTDLLSKLATATNVEVAIYSDTGRLEARFNKRAQRLFVEFASQVIK